MAIMKAFQCIRPRADLASQIAALPYDVYNRQEARKFVRSHPLSFLKIDRPESTLSKSINMYSQPVYDHARDTLNQMLADGEFIQDSSRCYYIYELTMNGRAQTGLVACASIDDYRNGIIMKHENTRADKEADRIHHVDTCSAQTGPIFLAYRSNETIHAMISAAKNQAPIYDFISEDGIGHRVWTMDAPDKVSAMEAAWRNIPSIYIADGHHRAASAVAVGLKRRKEHPDFDGTEEFNYFLSVSFPEDELKILDYNRVVADLNGSSVTRFIDQLRQKFEVNLIGTAPYTPAQKGMIGMYIEGRWYSLTVRDSLKSGDPVLGLDVSILQNEVLTPLLGIEDPKVDSRIKFMGGIKGLEALSHAVDAAGDGVAFAMYPTSMQELLAVADAKMLMPPKSTWFEPKLRSGLFIHKF